MRVVTRPSGRPMGLLEPGERLPANHPRDVLQRRGNHWYLVAPRQDPQPRDPVTGDHLPARTDMAKKTSKASIRRDKAQEAGLADRRLKQQRVAAGKRAKGTTRKGTK